MKNPVKNDRSLYAVLLIIAIFVVLSSATYLRNRVWRDQLTLWHDTVLKSPNKARPNYEVGHAYGDVDKGGYALYYMRKSIQLDGGEYFNAWLKTKKTLPEDLR